jgi:phospholipid/cholesterol/gamma-HCH transport system substrate-binding protein
MGRAGSQYARVGLTATAIVVVAIVAVTLLGGSGSQEYTLRAANAGQLVKGNLVKVGGAKAGIVESIVLTSNSEAQIKIRVDDDSLLPLHKGTRAEIRLSSLSSVAGRYISLLPGPNDAPALDPQTPVAATDVTVPVELDQLLSILNGETRRAFRSALRGSAQLYRGHTTDANAALRALNPALTEIAATAREVNRDDARFEQFLVQSASVMGVLARRNTDVDRGLTDAATTAAALAQRRRDLEHGLERAPKALRQASRTLTTLASSGRGLEGALRDARPVAPRLATLIKTLNRVLPRARPALSATSRLVPELTAALRALPQLSTVATPAFAAGSKALSEADPIVAGARPYVPDIVHGFLSGFGGQTFTYYDANGHYGRVRPMIYAGSTQTAGLLSSLLQTSVAGDAEQRQLLRRCPGSAADAAADGSNPFQPSSVDCDPEQVP